MNIRWVLPAACASGLASATTAFAQLNASPYARAPSAAEFAPYYPAKAMDLGREGGAIIDCAVVAGGLLNDCKIVREVPEGLGFGPAAIRMAKLFRMKDGHEGQRTQVPINFRLALSSGGHEEVVVTKKKELSFARQPGPDDLEHVRPTSAAGAGGGDVTLRCRVKSAAKLSAAERGTLFGCTAVKEDPAKAGFAEAAQKLVPMFQFEGDSLPVLNPSATIDVDLAWAAKTGG